MKKSDLRNKTVSQLRDIVREEDLQITGAWKMKKNDLVEELYDYLCEAWNIEDDETIVEEVIQEEQPQEVQEEEIKEVVQEEKKIEKVKTRKRKASSISVYKDGEFLVELPNLMETFKWSAENKICNSGWVRESLRSGRETTPGHKFKEGGYLFKYNR